MIIRLLLTVLLSLPFIAVCTAQSITTFEEIEFWVGNGDSCSDVNRSNSCAALVIDWHGESSENAAITWGYRWVGTVTAETMLRDVLQADNRLFAKLGADMGIGVGVYGLGYDGNDDQRFQLNDNTSFNANGIATTGPSDLALSDDSVDLYAEGWDLGFWHVATAIESSLSGNAWNSANFGVSGIELTDGQWVSLAFTTDTNSTTAIAENLLSAEVLFSTGDFQPDSVVDGLDLAIWQDGFGTVIPEEERPRLNKQFGNADGDRDVDGVDFLLWQRNFSPLLTSSLASAIVPEPMVFCMIAGGLLSSVLLDLFNRRSVS